MAATPVEVSLINDVAQVPAPDMLITGAKGVGYSDIVRIISAGEYKRGMLLMSMTGSDDFTPCTAAGLETAQVFAVMAENITVGENEYAAVCVYISGEFNENLVIFPWETESDNHADLVELARPALRRSSIYLRKAGK